MKRRRDELKDFNVVSSSGDLLDGEIHSSKT